MSCNCENNQMVHPCDKEDGFGMLEVGSRYIAVI